VRDEKLLVYIYDSNGNRAPALVIEKNPEQIAGIIQATQYVPEITITTELDQFFLNTSYGFVFKCTDQEYLQEVLLPVLIPIQLEESSVPELKIDWRFWAEDDESEDSDAEVKVEVDVEECKKYLKENFGVEV